MFDYNGEDHNLVGRDNQKHWTIHMDEFFDHYLLGKPRPDWMDKGVPYLDREPAMSPRFIPPRPSQAALSMPRKRRRPRLLLPRLLPVVNPSP